MHLEVGFIFGEDEKAKKDNANVIPRVGRMITSRSIRDTWKKKGQLIRQHTSWRLGNGSSKNGGG